MDFNLFVFLTLFGFLCLFLSRLSRSSGMGFGLGIIATMIFVLLGLLIGSGELITQTVYTDSPQLVTLNLGITNDQLAIIYFALAILSIFVGID